MFFCLNLGLCKAIQRPQGPQQQLHGACNTKIKNIKKNNQKTKNVFVVVCFCCCVMLFVWFVVLVVFVCWFFCCLCAYFVLAVCVAVMVLFVFALLCLYVKLSSGHKDQSSIFTAHGTQKTKQKHNKRMYVLLLVFAVLWCVLIGLLCCCCCCLFLFVLLLFVFCFVLAFVLRFCVFVCLLKCWFVLFLFCLYVKLSSGHKDQSSNFTTHVTQKTTKAKKNIQTNKQKHVFVNVVAVCFWCCVLCLFAVLCWFCVFVFLIASLFLLLCYMRREVAALVLVAAG